MASWLVASMRRVGVALCGLWLACTPAQAAPVKILFDTDMMTDCDDAGAMAVLHALADRGECEILATVVSVGDRWSVAAVDAINTYYGRPDLPLGAVKGKAVLEKSKFTRRIGEDFPNDFKSDAEIPDAVSIYREVLEKQPDDSVVVVTVGYLTNLRNLLHSPATPGHLSGLELIKRKVTTWVCMGGNFIGDPPVDDLKLGNVNFQRDAESALAVIRQWPRPVVFVGREIGSVPSGLLVGASLAATPADNPVRMAYFHYFGAQKSRHVADLTTVLYAVRGLRDYWDVQDKGRMDLHPDMTFSWQPGEAAGQAYLLKRRINGQPNDRAIERVLDELLIQSPRSRGTTLAATSYPTPLHLPVWLTHQTNDPSKVVINWHTDQPGDSTVEFGDTPALGTTVQCEESMQLHHVEIPFAGATVHYRFRSGKAVSPVYSIQSHPADELRIAVFADTGFMKTSAGEAIEKDRPHLMLSAGDHVPSLHNGQPVPVADTTAFLQLVKRYPSLFRSTPWMPLLGNHDREIRPRGPKPPEEPVYDIAATAFREFFALPDEEWKWHFDIPEFGMRFIALDLSHLSDQGTTWQTCHSPTKDGAQFGWYRDLMKASQQPFVVTLYNERNSTVRVLEGGDWGKLIGKGSLAVTGFGYFAERAEVEGFSYYNTSVSGTGAPYRDPNSAFFKNEDNYLLLTARRRPRELKVELKNLGGEVLEGKTFSPRPGSNAE